MKRSRKAATPSTLSVPGVRALLGSDEGDTTVAGTPLKPAVAKPRKRKPKFVF